MRGVNMKGNVKMSKWYGGIIIKIQPTKLKSKRKGEKEDDDDDIDADDGQILLCLRLQKKQKANF